MRTSQGNMPKGPKPHFGKVRVIVLHPSARGYQVAQPVQVIQKRERNPVKDDSSFKRFPGSLMREQTRLLRTSLLFRLRAHRMGKIPAFQLKDMVIVLAALAAELDREKQFSFARLNLSIEGELPLVSAFEC